MKGNNIIKEELTELLETYYNGSFAQMVGEYIRKSGMSAEEVEGMAGKMDIKKGQYSVPS